MFLTVAVHAVRRMPSALPKESPQCWVILFALAWKGSWFGLSCSSSPLVSNSSPGGQIWLENRYIFLDWILVFFPIFENVIYFYFFPCSHLRGLNRALSWPMLSTQKELFLVLLACWEWDDLSMWICSLFLQQPNKFQEKHAAVTRASLERVAWTGGRSLPFISSETEVFFSLHSVTAVSFLSWFKTCHKLCPLLRCVLMLTL